MHGGRSLTALVADAHHPNSVAGIRGLGRAGVRVVAGGPDRPAAGGRGRPAAWRGAAPPLPAVVKPALPVGVLETARVVVSRAELDALLDELPPDEPVVVQEPVAGTL